ncbi:hypothetical protein WOC76_22470 [Methylocystis sp. IM3]|uniref:hypothetical protein n=1 Tax=unclassified Methylocystis TaxID=2625913 RepID=UPI000FC1B15E|nr:MAG: hypothetical protein EKK29_12080 [Hyphomicrobiales bacterium]
MRAGIDDAAEDLTKAALKKLFEIVTSGSAVFSHQSEIKAKSTTRSTTLASPIKRRPWLYHVHVQIPGTLKLRWEEFMVSFTFSAEEISAAPPEVRRWIESQIVKALGSGKTRDESPSNVEAGSLAQCSLDDAVRIFQLISRMLPVVQVFFELGRDSHSLTDPPSLHCLHLDEIQRHLQFDDPQLLAECLGVLDQAFEQVRNDPQISLFATDDQGRIFIHQTSYEAIRKLREQLHRAQASGIPNEAQFDRDGIKETELARPEYAFGSPSRRHAE